MAKYNHEADIAQEYPREFLLGTESGKAALLLALDNDTAFQVMRTGSKSKTGRGLLTTEPFDVQAYAAFTLGVVEEVALRLEGQTHGAEL